MSSEENLQPFKDKMDEFLNRGEKTTEYDFVYSLFDSTVSEFHLNIKLNNELQCLALCIKSLMYLCICTIAVYY